MTRDRGDGVLVAGAAASGSEEERDDHSPSYRFPGKAAV